MTNLELTKKNIYFGSLFYLIFFIATCINMKVNPSGFSFAFFVMNLILSIDAGNAFKKIDESGQSLSKVEWLGWWFVRLLTIIIVFFMLYYLSLDDAENKDSGATDGYLLLDSKPSQPLRREMERVCNINPPLEVISSDGTLLRRVEGGAVNAETLSIVFKCNSDYARKSK